MQDLRREYDGRLDLLKKAAGKDTGVTESIVKELEDDISYFTSGLQQVREKYKKYEKKNTSEKH